MTRKKDKQTISIFEFITRQAADPAACAAPGSCDIDSKFRAAVADDIRHAKDEHGRELGQPEVAGRMSVLTGDNITSDQLYSWTADSKKGQKGRNMPAVYTPALAVATNSHHAMDVLARGASGFYMPSLEALEAEIYRFDQEAKEIQRQKREREQLRAQLLRDAK